MFRMLIYWECLLLWCKCICIAKLCLCRQRNSFYSLVPIENAFWCNLSAFTFSASLPLNECLWDYILNFSISVSQVHAHILVSGVPACLGKKKKKKFPQDPSSTGKNRASNLPEIEFACTSRGRKKIPSETQVLETRVPLVWTFKKHSKQSTWNRVCLHVQRKKKNRNETWVLL